MPVKQYRVLTGINYTVRGKDVRREPGEVVADIPAKSLAIYLDRGHVAPQAPKHAAHEEDET